MQSTKYPPFVYRKGRIYYFSRRIPADLKQHYKRSRIALSLRTNSLKAARIRAATLAGKLDQDWLALRWKNDSDPFSRFLIDHTAQARISSSAPILSEAKELYVSAKGKDRAITFHQGADRAVQELVSLCGDKPIDTYTRVEANRQVRRDDLGYIIHWPEYGNLDSDFGWEIDHIQPTVLGGLDIESNLRALNWRANAGLGGLLRGLRP